MIRLALLILLRIKNYIALKQSELVVDDCINDEEEIIIIKLKPTHRF